PGQSSRRRERLSPRLRAGLLAAGAAARLEPGVSLGPADALGRARRRAADRAPADAAARTLRADPLRQDALKDRAMWFVAYVVAGFSYVAANLLFLRIALAERDAGRSWFWISGTHLLTDADQRRRFIWAAIFMFLTFLMVVAGTALQRS